MSQADSRPQRRGLVVHRHRSIAGPVLVEGLRLDRPTEILLACARDLALLDLVVVLDAALHVGACTRGEVSAAGSQRRRGAPRLRAALALADTRSESSWETLLRLLHVSCEIDVVPQTSLYDDRGGFLGRADLWLRGTNALHEYDGAHHLDRQQQRLDLRRARRLGNEEWVRRGYTSADVLQQGVGILRDADLSLGREHRPARIRKWHQLLKESAFTATGQERLRQRLNLAGPESGARWASRSA
jgi:hypothetical protein